MSTISKALQKQKTDQNIQINDNIALESGHFKWKVVLLSALLVIISLLAVLIYIQFYPVNRANTYQPIIVENTSAQKKEAVVVEPAPALSRREKLAKPAVQKFTFVTKPLPPVKTEKKETFSSVAPVQYTKPSEDTLKNSMNTASQSVSATLESDKMQDDSDTRDLHQMSYAFQEKVPAMRYDFHVYSTIAKDSWIRINGEDLYEGKFVAGGKIKLIEIKPQRSIFRLGGQRFSLESLKDWKGY